MANAISSAPYRYQARILLHAPAAVIAGELPPTVGTVTPADGERCVLATGSDSLSALVFHLGSLGCEFTVLEPPELVKHVRLLAERLRRAAS